MLIKVTSLGQFPQFDPRSPALTAWGLWSGSPAMVRALLSVTVRPLLLHTKFWQRRYQPSTGAARSA